MIITNSNFVANRIQKYWNENAEVIYPCINIGDFQLSNKNKGFFVTFC